MKATYGSEEWVILFSDLSGKDRDPLPDLIDPGRLDNGASGLRRLDGDFVAEPAEQELAEAYSHFQDNFLTNGSIAILPDGGPALYLKLAREERVFDLSSGKGIHVPQGVAWHRSWRLHWLAGASRKELFTINAKPA